MAVFLKQNSALNQLHPVIMIFLLKYTICGISVKAINSSLLTQTPYILHNVYMNVWNIPHLYEPF